MIRDVHGHEAQVADNLARVRATVEDACRAAGRHPGDVRLIAVSKRQPPALVQAAVAAGQIDLGENHVQALLERQVQLAGAPVVWHLIGHLQTNKANRAVRAHWIHTVDSVRVARALAAAHAADRPAVRLLVQVNVSAESQKSGVAPADARALIEAMRGMPGMAPAGLMCIPAPGEGRRGFAALRELRDRLARETGVALSELSMGMSSDYPDAIAEGATLVRVGTAIFGERPTPG